MDNLSTDQLNDYIEALGSDIRISSSSFLHENASGEAVYSVVVVGDEDDFENQLYIRRLSNGNLRADISSLT
jgi:hypothetical protein